MSKSPDYEVMASWTPEMEYPMNPFNEVYLLLKFDVSGFSMTGDIDFQIGHFTVLSSSNLIVILITLGKSHLTLLVYFHWLWAVGSYFTKVQQNIRLRKTIQTVFIWQKIQEPHIGSGTSHFQWFNQQLSRNEFPT